MSELKNPITSDAASTWFKSQFGETRSIAPSKPSFTGTSPLSSDYFFEEPLDITPLWSESKISAYLKTVPILYVPVKPIVSLDDKGFQYTLVFFRDSLNQLDARLQVYMASPHYKKANLIFNVKNFSGYFFQIHLNGKVDRVLGVENGQFVLRAEFEANPRFNPKQVSTRCLCCECWDSAIDGIVDEIRCFFCSLGWSNGSSFTPTVQTIAQNDGGGGGISSSDWSLGYGGFSGVSLGDGSISYGGDTGGSTTTTGGYGGPNNNVQSGFVATLENSINNDMFDISNNSVEYQKAVARQKYRDAGFSDMEFEQIWANSSLFQQVDAFLKTNGFTNENRLNVKGFTFLLEADDDFKTLNKNRGNKSIKQLLDEVGYPKINARTMMWLARKNGVTYFKDGKEEINFFRLGRIQEDAVIRSIQGVSKNTKAYQDPLGQRISTIPDIVTEGFTVRSENGIPKEIWSSSECSFLDSKFTATGIIKDNVTTTDQGEIRQQLSTMIDVLANMKGVVYNSLIMPNWKPADHGIATLTIVTIHDAEIDPILVKQAKTKNVRMHKRWLELDLETQKIKVSTNFQLTVNPATNKGWDVPTLRSDAVDFNWSVQ